MIFLVSEHKREVEPLLESLPFKKRGEFFIYNDILLYINYGRGGLSLGFKTARVLSTVENIGISLLFGYAGSVGDLKIGEFVSLKSVKLFDKSLNPLFNPINVCLIKELKSVDGITLMGGYSFDNEYLRLFGDCIDRESYFFAKALKSLDKFGIILKVISDNNTMDGIAVLRKFGFKYNVDWLKGFLLDLVKINRDEISEEIFRYSGILDRKRLNGIKNVIELKHLTFSRRQRLYKNVKINSSKCDPVPMKIEAVFIEKGVREERIKLNLSRKKVFYVDDYVGYFHNLKDRKAILFANKKGDFVRKTPNNYTPDAGAGYSILASYNCIYDCAYCFLKGYFRSFNPVLFLNYENYFDEIEKVIKADGKRPLYFYAGTFSDPLALGFASDFAFELVSFFSVLQYEDVFLELRTKSDKVSNFLKVPPSRNVIFAFSISPKSVFDRYEFFAPSLESRFKAIRMLDSAGFQIGIRIDPVIIDCVEDYKILAAEIEKIKNLHSIEIGFLRFDKNDFKNMLYKNPCSLKGLRFSRGMYRYAQDKILSTLNSFEAVFGRFYLSMEYEI